MSSLSLVYNDQVQKTYCMELAYMPFLYQCPSLSATEVIKVCVVVTFLRRIIVYNQQIQMTFLVM
jgi:hypothetical protein